ncbi:D-glutamate cyclase family protein [Glycomyces salinus]|uniref:D-glutamate cyclase family protein n=1 Tax=Glycomyces salinus TaxID=980294 RepID=UPI0018EE334E|nr:DUF1445 domain-containing protein [Glycomyces salinus]
MISTQRPDAGLLPADARARFREGLVASTGGWAPGFVQTGMISVPRRHAVALRRFAVRNLRACPLLDIIGPGRFTTSLAEGADLRRDLPAYLVWRSGTVVDWRQDVSSLWGEDLVTFLVGAAYTSDGLLRRNGIPIRALEQGRITPLYYTGMQCMKAGRFRSRLVVSMRPIPAPLVPRAAMVTSTLPDSHGMPIWAGAPSHLGISDLTRPDFGEPVEFGPEDVPVFWASAVTLQEAVAAARIPFAITNAPGHLLVTDRKARQAAVGGRSRIRRPKPKAPADDLDRFY